MRKFYAAIALCITLIGTFAPVVFSVSILENAPKIKLQKSIVDAEDDVVETTFNPNVVIEKVPNQNGYYTIKTSIRYQITGIPDGTPLVTGVAVGAAYGATAGGLLGATIGSIAAIIGNNILYDPELRVKKVGTNTFVYSDDVNPRPTNLKDGEFGGLNQTLALTPGEYEAWFLQNSVGSDVLSSKIKFTISQNGDVVNITTANNGINQNNDTKFTFIEYPQVDIDPTKPTEAKVSGKFKYLDPTKPTPSTENAPVDVSLILSDPTDTGPREAGKVLQEKNISVSGKLNTEISFTFTVTGLVAAKKYEVHLVENKLTTSAGKKLISNYIPFTAGTPVDNAAIQEQIQQENAEKAQQALEDLNQQNNGGADNPGDCEIYDLFCHAFRLFLTFFQFIPNAVIAAVGIITDWSIHYSISSDSMRDMSDNDSLVYKGWKITRDFANIGFIFALFVAAFGLILNKNTFNFDPKKTIARVIVMALLINFSMMFSRVIIQTGDLFANIFYNKIDVEAGNTCRDPNGNVDITKIVTTFESGPVDILRCLGIKGVTTAIISQINPQKLLLNTGADYNIDTLQNVGIELKGWAYYTQTGFLTLITFAITFVLIYMFGSIAMMFSTRVFMFWILIIISPIAFVSHAIPQLEDSEYFGFKNWLDQLVKLAFSAPVFLFFVYLVVTFLKTAPLGLSTNPNWGGFWGSFMVIVAKLTATIFILMKGKKIAFELGGKAGDITNKIISKTTGALVNAGLTAATGGTAVIGRQVLGRAGAALAESGMAKNLMKSNSFTGKFLGTQMSKAGRSVSAMSFDPRDSKGFKGMIDKVNSSMGENIKIGDTYKVKGGFEEEGGIRDVTNKARKAFEEYKIKQDADIVERLKPSKSSKEERDKRAAEAELERVKQIAAAEESKIENEAMEADTTEFINKKQADAAKAQAEKQNLEAEKTAAENAKNIAQIAKNTAETQKAALEGTAKQLEVQESSLKTQKKQLEQQKNNATDPGLKAVLEEQIKDKQTQIEDVKEEKEKALKMAKEKADEVKTKDGEIKAKEAVIKNKEKDIKEKNTIINKAATYASILPDIANVRQAQQERRDLEALEAISAEKKDMVSAQEKMQKQDEKRKKLISDIEALGKKKANLTGAQLAQAEAELIQKNDELSKEEADYFNKENDFKLRKSAYDKLFGDKLTALKDFEAEAVKIYKERSDIKQRIESGNKAVLDAQLSVNKLQDVVENTAHAHITDYLNTLEQNTSMFGEMGDHANTRSKDSIRRKYLNKK